MSFYDFDVNTINEQLLPPQLRQPRHLAWLRVLGKPLQWIRDVFFDSYINGASPNYFDDAQFYIAPDRVVMKDNSVWESLNQNPELGSVSSPLIDPENWTKVQDVYIGVTERMAYNSQIIVFEYALNRWFQNPLGDQIYIQNNDTNNQLLMGNTSAYSGALANTSLYQGVVMGNTYSPTPFDYTIYVPSALFATLGATTQDQENAIRNIANKYNAAGIRYNVLTF